MMPKPLRLQEFVRRLRQLPAASDFDGAWRQINDTMNAVEDQMTDIPFDPSAWRTDGRLYPPQADGEKPCPGLHGVRRFRTKEHNVYIGSNGAVLVRAADGVLLLSKPGADGKGLGGT